MSDVLKLLTFALVSGFFIVYYRGLFNNGIKLIGPHQGKKTGLVFQIQS